MGRNGFAGRSVYQSANDGQGRLRSTILQINSWGEKGNEQAKEIGGLLRVFAGDGVFGGGARNGGRLGHFAAGARWPWPAWRVIRELIISEPWRAACGRRKTGG